MARTKSEILAELVHLPKDLQDRFLQANPQFKRGGDRIMEVTGGKPADLRNARASSETFKTDEKKAG